jgi:hypothetical protein
MAFLHPHWQLSGSLYIALFQHHVNGSKRALLAAVKVIQAHQFPLEYHENGCIE